MRFLKLFSTLVLLALIGRFDAPSSTHAQESTSPVVKLICQPENDTKADRASGRLMIRIPSATDSSGDDTGPDSETPGQPPTEPSGPQPETFDPPQFFGEAVGGSFVAVIDVSNSMERMDVDGAEDYDGNMNPAPTRLEIVKYELVKAVKELGEGDKFDLVLLAGATTDLPISDAWQGSLIDCTEETKENAVSYIKGLTTWFGTPSYQALERATHDYGNELDVLIFLSDGVPFPHDLGNRAHSSAILEDFPGWFSELKNNSCRFVCIQAGQSKKAGAFMQKLAAANNGEFIQK